jgi:hypothetical protein
MGIGIGITITSRARRRFLACHPNCSRINALPQRPSIVVRGPNHRAVVETFAQETSPDNQKIANLLKVEMSPEEINAVSDMREELSDDGSSAR